MNPIERPGLNGTGIRLTSAAAAPVARTEAARPAPSASAKDGAKGVQTSLAGSEPLVDVERVAVIRKAVEEGRYPVVPTRIADAMIAAGYLLRTKQ